VEAPEAPSGGQVFLDVIATWCDFDPRPRALAALAQVRQAGTPVDLQAGDRVAVIAPPPSNVLLVPRASCWPLAPGADAARSLLATVLAGVLCAVHRGAAALGSSAVVSGDNLQAELLLQVLRAAGMRAVCNVRSAEAPPPLLPVEPLFRGSPADYQEALAAHLQPSRGPVIAYDTTSRSSVILSLLAALPKGSTLVLLSGEGSGSASVNFYRDVHRKNLQVVGSPPAAAEEPDFVRASRLLETGRIDPDRFPVANAFVSTDRVPGIGDARWVLLHWNAPRG
jgi:threonine dehydrogenase-like Zn-dependent dehydrogenase